MNSKDLLDVIKNAKRKKELANVARKFVIGVSVVAGAGLATGVLFTVWLAMKVRENLRNKTEITVETIRNTAQHKAKTVKESAAQATQEACNVIEEVCEKTEDIKADIKDGCHEIAHDIHKTADNISHELNKNSK